VTRKQLRGQLASFDGSGMMPFVIELGWLMSVHRDHCFAAFVRTRPRKTAGLAETGKFVVLCEETRLTAADR
jgi:hypothetical protein